MYSELRRLVWLVKDIPCPHVTASRTPGGVEVQPYTAPLFGMYFEVCLFSMTEFVQTEPRPIVVIKAIWNLDEEQTD